MKITSKNLHREIREFNNRQKLNVEPEMFLLWEYKLSKTDGSRNSLFDILNSYNVHLRLANSEIKNISDVNSDEFFFMLSLYKEYNIKLANFCSKMIKDF